MHFELVGSSGGLGVAAHVLCCLRIRIVVRLDAAAVLCLRIACDIFGEQLEKIHDGR